MSVSQWSKTPSLNATSDAGINLRDNQAPSVVKFNGRTMMADVSQWRDDLAGVITTTGTSTAYAVASNQIFTALTDGLVIACTMHATNGAAPTLAVDGLTAKPLRLRSAVNPGAGLFVAGSPYVFVYRLATDEWIAFCVYDVAGELPIGAFSPYSGISSPSSNFVLPFGQALSRATYATLFSRTGTAFGVGDGTTTFNIIDLRGRSPFGLDNMGGVAAGRVTAGGSGINGVTLGAVGGADNVTLARSALPNVTLPATGLHQPAVNGNGAIAAFSGSISALVDLSFSGTQQYIYSTQQMGFLDNKAVNVTTSSINGNVTQTVVNNMAPTVMCNWLLRVL